MDSYDLFKQAADEWEKGKKKTAFKLFLKAALLGESSAQHNVGFFYDVGEGVRKDSKKALYWYKKSWKNKGQSDSLINIGLLYFEMGNNRRGIYWLSKAVDKNDGDAALELAKFYLKRKRKADEKKAIDLLKKMKKTKHVTESSREEAVEILLNIRQNKNTQHKVA